MAQLFDLVFLDSLSAPLIRLIADVSIKGAFLLLAASVLTFACRRCSAAARHLVWSLALTSLLALPLLSLMLPAWQVAALSALLPQALPEVLPQASPGAGQAEPSSTGAAQVEPEQSPAPASVSAEDRSPGSLTVRTRSTGPGAAAAPSNGKFSNNALLNSLSGQAPADEAAGARASNYGEPASFRLPVWLLLIWLSGASAILARLLVGTASVRRIARKADRVTDPSRLLMVRSLSWQLGLAREVELLASERISMPLTFGAFRSVVLLPAEAALWEDERLQIVLLHELAHVKRKDCLTQLTAHLSCALHWFNPLIWIALRELRIERERACDDYVLHTGTKASDYASHLLDIARALGEAECSSFATVAIARRSQLEGRLLAILDPSLSRKGLKRMPKFLIAFTLISIIMPLAAIQPKAQARELMGQSPAQQVADVGTVAPFAPSVSAEFATAAARSSKAAQESMSTEQPEASYTAPSSIEGEPGAESERGEGQAPEQAEKKDRSGIADALTEALKDEDAEVRMNALRALAGIGDPRAIDGLILGVKDPDPNMREAALQGLAMMSDARTVEPLIEALKDQNAQVREKAAWGLGLKSDGRVVDPLIDALRDEVAQVREKAAWALGLKGDDRVIAPLIAALNDRNGEVRQQAAWALGLQGDSRAVEPLMAALKDESAGTREKAAWALGLKGDERAVNALQAATKDPNNEVSQKARWALGLIQIRAGKGPGAARPMNDDNDPDPKIDMRLKIANRINIKLNPAPAPAPNKKN